MREGGSLPHVGPNPGAGGGGPYWCGFFVQAPWRTYVNYNDPPTDREILFSNERVVQVCG